LPSLDTGSATTAGPHPPFVVCADTRTWYGVADVSMCPFTASPILYLSIVAPAEKEAAEITSVYDAAMASDVPMVVLAGSQYGTGSSRDWAAKGTYLLGVKAVIATSFERIHRSNLVGMGVLPLTFKDGDDSDSLGLDGTESFDIPVNDDVQALQELTVTAHKSDGSSVNFLVDVRLDTPVDVEYYRNGGILHTVLRKLAQ